MECPLELPYRPSIKIGVRSLPMLRSRHNICIYIPLPRPKMVMNNEKAQVGLVFFSLGWGEGGSDFYFIFWGLIPNVFPLCSHQVLKMFSPDSPNVPQVPNVLPKTFPITPHIFLTPLCGGSDPFFKDIDDGPIK